MTLNKAKKYLVPIILISISFYISFLVYSDYKIGKIIDDSDLITHYGLFIGFGLTIYTFVISVLDNIVSRIDNNSKVKNKEGIIKNVFSGVKHLKEDVFVIFLIFIIQILLMLIENALCQFALTVIIIKHALFIYSLIILFDVCRVLFGISEVSLTLLNNRNSEE